MLWTIITVGIAIYVICGATIFGVCRYVAKQKRIKKEKEAEEKRKAKEAADREAARLQYEQYEREMSALMEERKKKEEERKAREKAEAEERAKREEEERLAREEAWKKQQAEMEKAEKALKKKAYTRWSSNARPEKFSVVNGAYKNKQYFLLVRDIKTSEYSVIETTKEEYKTYDEIIGFKSFCRCLAPINQHDYRIKVVLNSEWEHVF